MRHPDDVDEERFARWVGECRSVGCRLLTPEERVAVETRRMRSQRRRRLAAQIPAILIAADLGVIALGYGLLWWGVCAGLVAFLSLAIAPLVWRDMDKDVKRSSAELEDGRVEAFVAPEPTDSELPGRTQPPFETLRGSGRVLTWDGAPERKPRFAYVVSVAKAPAARHRPVMPLRIAEFQSSTGGALSERALSADERQELAGMIDRLSLRRRPNAVIGWAYVGGIGLANLVRQPKEPSAALAGLALVALWIIISFFLGKRLLLRRRLTLDLARGVTHAPASSSASLRTNHGVFFDAEFLPYSGVLWTSEGQPATWRRG